MCKLFDDWSAKIREYCEQNGLDYEKASKLSKCWGKNDLILQYFDKEKASTGLLDETPMPVVLWIKKDETGQLHFEQTEYTAKYIGRVS